MSKFDLLKKRLFLSVLILIFLLVPLRLFANEELKFVSDEVDGESPGMYLAIPSYSGKRIKVYSISISNTSVDSVPQYLTDSGNNQRFFSLVQRLGSSNLAVDPPNYIFAVPTSTALYFYSPNSIEGYIYYNLSYFVDDDPTQLKSVGSTYLLSQDVMAASSSIVFWIVFGVGLILLVLVIILIVFIFK